MKRFPDWETRIGVYLESLRDQPFLWGKLDCAIFAAGAVKAMTGVDPMQGLRGYRSEQGANKILKEKAGGTLARFMDSKFERVPVGFAHRGDIVMVVGGLGISMGAVSLHVGSEDGREGLVKNARSTWRRAWSVPMPDGTNG